LTVDVRVIAATNKHLEQEITRGASVRTFFYRSERDSLLRARLRDRMEDIPTLARYFCVNSVGLRKENDASWVTPDEILIRYPWPEMSRTAKPRRTAGHRLSPGAYRTASPSPELFRGAAESPHPSLLDAARSTQRLRAGIHSAETPGESLEHDANGHGSCLERSHLYRAR